MRCDAVQALLQSVIEKVNTVIVMTDLG